jgi:hypothetical protein
VYMLLYVPWESQLNSFFHKTQTLVDMEIAEKCTEGVLRLCHASDLRRGVNGYVDPRHAKDMSSEEEHQYVCNGIGESYRKGRHMWFTQVS